MRILTEVPSENASLTCFLHDETEAVPNRAPRPCVIVCPGGGYEFLSPREADPVALEFFAKGFQVFLLYYGVLEDAKDLRPLRQISDTVAFVRRNAAKYNTAPDKIAVMGFSAGGHLCASLGVRWDSPELKALTGELNGLNRPDAMVLCYPVISSGEFAHRGSIDRLTGFSGKKEDEEFFSLEKNVTDKAPPAFLWHTVNDTCVPVENALLLATALQKAHVPFEMHIFPEGTHGLSMCSREVGTENKRCADWVPLCEKWLSDLFQFVY